jgi:hypothetical protein
MRYEKNKIALSLVLGCVIGIVIGIYGWIMNVSPLYVGIFSGATTGCCIVILLESENIKLLKSLGARK